jgi:SAM-dependent methyltransferase
MKKLNTYLSLCTEVYDLSKPNPPEDAYPFYRSYAIDAQGPILEPMCGTGRFLLPLLEEGFDVHGFDASESMLEKLYMKANAKNINPNAWTGFLEDFKKAEKYRLIFIPSGSFSLISELSSVKKALKTAYDHLGENGLFVFETETLHAVPKELGIWRGSRWQRADGKVIMLSQLAMMDGPICYSIGKYELVNGNDIIQTEVEEYKIRIYNEPALLQELLTEAGFSEVRLVKAFNRETAPKPGDETIIYECRK